MGSSNSRRSRRRSRRPGPCAGHQGRLGRRPGRGEPPPLPPRGRAGSAAPPAWGGRRRRRRRGAGPGRAARGAARPARGPPAPGGAALRPPLGRTRGHHLVPPGPAAGPPARRCSTSWKSVGADGEQQAAVRGRRGPARSCSPGDRPRWRGVACRPGQRGAAAGVASSSPRGGGCGGASRRWPARSRSEGEGCSSVGAGEATPNSLVRGFSTSVVFVCSALARLCALAPGALALLGRNESGSAGWERLCVCTGSAIWRRTWICVQLVMWNKDIPEVKLHARCAGRNVFVTSHEVSRQTEK